MSKEDMFSKIKIGIATAIALGTFLVGMNDASAETDQTIKGKITPKKVLELVYGRLSKRGGKLSEPAIWKNINLWSEYARDFRDSFGVGEVFSAFEARYKEYNVDKYILITQTIPAGIGYGCHACAPLIGAIILRKNKDGWRVESENKYIGNIGRDGNKHFPRFNGHTEGLGYNRTLKP